MHKNLVWAAVALALIPNARAQQIDPRDARFTVGDIRVEGLQRVSEGTVYNYLPVNIGDELGTQRLRSVGQVGAGFAELTYELPRKDRAA